LLSAKQIAPGQSGEISVEVAARELGFISKTVTVTTNDPLQPQIILTIKAEVQPEFALSQRSIWFGSNPGGKEISREILVTVSPDRNSKVLSAESTDRSVAVKLEPVSDSNGQKLKVLAIQKSDAKDGYHFGMIILKTTSNLIPEVKIPVRGQITSGQSK
jgi:hypothetical protein